MAYICSMELRDKTVPTEAEYLKKQIKGAIENISDVDVNKLAIVFAEEIQRTHPMYQGNLNPVWSFYDSTIKHLNGNNPVGVINNIDDFLRTVRLKLDWVGVSVDENTTFDSLTFDDLDAIELILEIEKVFGVEIEINENYYLTHTIVSFHQEILKNYKKVH